jgi:hypothetical protein
MMGFGTYFGPLISHLYIKTTSVQHTKIILLFYVNLLVHTPL